MSIPASIEQFVALNGVPFTPIHHRVAFTAQEEAAVTHVDAIRMRLGDFIRMVRPLTGRF